MSRKQFRRVVVWFRRDLRVDDNRALSEACAGADEVIPLFVVDDERFARPDTGAARVFFLFDALKVLDANLCKLGGRLIVRSGKSPQALVKAVVEFGADAVYFHTEYEPFGKARDDRACSQLAEAGIAVRTFTGLSVDEPAGTLTQSGKPYAVFTPYKRVWFDMPMENPCAAPLSIRVPELVASEPLPTAQALNVSTDQVFERGGEDAARRHLKNFIGGGLATYAACRDLVAENGTSRLSSHLHFGTISARKVVHAAVGKDGADAFLSEIAWRDFYLYILHHHPHVEKGAFRRPLDKIKWENNERHFESWCNGRTGYPMIDAAMRQLNQEAWMHNRARMITASFLTKDLLINWQWGERYFMQKLVDGDLASNNGGWQWSAGTGTDAQPYFRIFNPVLQGEKFDPSGSYVRRYVPELSKVPSAVIHAPWKLSPLEQEACGCILGKDYPFPIVDHAKQRGLALSLYKAAGDAD